MSQIGNPPETLADDGPLTVPEYRAVSKWAMAALGLGLLSGISVISPLLGIVPLAALVIGGYALRQVHREGLAGRWMAVAPLVLAPLFLGWGCSREISRREIFVAHAREFADDCLSILNQNEPYYAHQMMMDQKQRLDPHLNFEIAYQGNDRATEEYQRYMGTSPFKDILLAAPQVQFQFEEDLLHKHHDDLTDVVTLQYSYQTPGAEKKRFWITVQRTYSNYTGRADWRMSDPSILKPRGS
ncbi:MAG: DUF4190 domain-containing protein [Pirellulaceae bacterium]|nr:DUF4190 domain-containing protein [Pirellulaceae bacterium]